MDKKWLYSQLPDALLPWYDAHHRELPWREDKDPYHIWVSEIMLQQTRVEAVKGYYARFLQVLPDVKSLAECEDDLLHKLWEGLGYYNRVRNMKKAALQIMTDHNGRFPTDHAQVLALPGIGAYTAGAICSIAFNQPTPAVDGNVLRVISRITDDATPIDLPTYKNTVQQNLAEIYPERAGDFTQALMDLGATVCLPNGEPLCADCPARAFCAACAQNRQKELPVRISKTRRRTEEKTVFLLLKNGEAALRQRPNTGLLAGLWEYPHAEGTLDEATAAAQLSQWGVTPLRWVKRLQFHHIFTHIRWEMTGYVVEVQGEGCADWQWCGEEERARRAVPSAFEVLTRELPQG